MTTINSVGKAKQIVREISKAIVGKDDVLIKVLLAVIAGGHILMEDIPGVRRKQEGRDGTGYGFEIHDLCCPFSSPNRSSHCKTARDQCDCR